MVVVLFESYSPMEAEKIKTIFPLLSLLVILLCDQVFPNESHVIKVETAWKHQYPWLLHEFNLASPLIEAGMPHSMTNSFALGNALAGITFC